MTKLTTWQATIQDDDTGAAVVSPVVTIRVGGPAGVIADLFDITGAPIANPVTGGLDGFVQVQMRPGRYWVQADDGGTFSNAWYEDVLPNGGLSWSTRDELVSDIAAGMNLPDGTVVSDGSVFYVRSDGETAISDMPNWLPSLIVHPEHFGAVRDGVTDDTVPLQAAVDFCASSRRFGMFFGGVYATSSGIVWKEGANFIATGNWSGVSSTSRDAGTTVILYTGPAVANSCVVRVSSLSVGVEGSAADQIENMGLASITVDGNDVAEFGFYFNRSWSNSRFDFLTATGCTKHGFWAGNCWNASHRNWVAFKNIGSGISLGINTFSWTRCAVDQSSLSSFFGYYSGHNSSTVAQNAFNELGGEALEYGIGIGSARGLLMLNAQGQECSGAGIYLDPNVLGGPLSFVGGYAEKNGKSSGATRPWDLWYSPDVNTHSTKFTGFRFGDTANGAIKITGSPNTARREGALVLDGLPFLPTIDADHDKWRLLNCDRDPTSIVGVQPMYFGGRINSAQNLTPIGVAVFYVDAGSVVELRKEGAITGITYNAAGEYTLTLSETMSGADWLAQCHATADNRYARSHTYTATSCLISHKSFTGAADDPTGANIPIRVVVYPSYT